MAEFACPFCKETVKADAMVCKNCHSRLRRSREEMFISAVSTAFAGLTPAQLAAAKGGILASLPAVTDCNAWCVWRHQGDKVGLQQCLDDCKAEAAIKAVAEKLRADLEMTLFEIIWAGGDIDPRPLEKAVRERFAKDR